MDKRETRWGLAWLVICGVAGIVVCVFECHAFNEEEPAQGSRSRDGKSSTTIKPSNSRLATYSACVVIAIFAIFVWSNPKQVTDAYAWVLKSYSNIAIAKSQPLSPVELFQRVSPSVFVVEALDEKGKTLMLGSGVALARDFLITNCHVVQSGFSLSVSRGKEHWPARLIQAVPSHDLCGLRPSGLTLQPVEVRPSSKLATGERVYAIGSPEGLELTFSEGVISALRETEGVHMIQTSAPISPGSSGGGLFDAQGNLVGITSFQLKEGQSLNFANPGEWVSGILSSSVAATAKSSTSLSDAELESKAWLEIGLEAVKKEDYDLALDSLRKCADLKQSDAPRAMLEPGQLAERRIDLYGTLPAYKAWFEQSQFIPAEAQVWAIAMFEKAIELKPDYAEAWLELAKTHQQRKEYDQAISAAKEATRLAPRGWWGWVVLGTCYIDTESYAEAIATLQEAEKIAPVQGDTVAPDVQKGIVLLFLGEAYAGKGDREQVLRIYQELKNTNTKMAEDFFKWYVLPHPESARP
ncbi:MAG: tetratricopeptide repeat-containing serine protease family protein [Candidatus Acidiferrum sp.]